MPQSVGVIGLGAMGLGMAATLAKAGFRAEGWDLSPERRAAAEAAGIAVKPAETLLAEADIAVLSLPDAAAVRAALLGGSALAKRRRSLTIVDTSTVAPQDSRALAADLAAIGHAFLDAPVSGGPAGAAGGKLTMMVGGPAEALAAARPVIDMLAQKVIHAGGPGAGSAVKLVNNMLVACHMLTTREALRLAEASGVDVGTIFAAVNGATGRSAISEVHYPTWVLSGRFDSGFSAGLMRKDLKLALAMAKALGVRTELAQAAAALWDEAASGLADADDFTRIARAPGDAS